MADPDATLPPHRREEDKSWPCRVAHTFSLGWDFIDKRQIDCWIVSIFTLMVTYKLTEWSIDFANTSARSGSDIALIIAAVNTPWALLQAAVVKFVFDARKSTFETK